ncbi:unnamed protein product [Caenorhabditis angaria]|uniref:Uncharacterized protein n=1 Tax=Caenorhabditis angaria TaxID=860376 RepID=A0A9P1IN75_9PELO|nr:unnamed protein product [Caenorhabditis angaria]
MVAKADLGAIFKYVMIGLGVLHLLIGILAVVECVREGVTLGDIFPSVKDSSFSISMLPPTFTPFLVGAICLVFAFIPIYYIIIPIILLGLIESGLFLWTMIKIFDFESDLAKMKDPLAIAFLLILMQISLEEMKDRMETLEGIYVFNKVICGMGIFVGVATIAVAAFLAFKHRPGGGGSRSFSSTATS